MTGAEDKDMGLVAFLFWSLPGRDGIEGVKTEGVKEGKKVVDSPLDKEEMEPLADRGGRPRPPIVTS